MKIINNTNRKINLNNVCFVEPLKCIDASIYYEDNKPYIDWKGETKLSDGSIVKVYIPKMGLDIKEIENNQECVMDNFGNKIKAVHTTYVTNMIYPVNGNLLELQIKEREMTKEQIEKELGYKVKIKE